MKTKKITLNELKKLVKQIVTEETILNEGLPIGNSKLSQSLAQTLNIAIGKMERPDVASKARALAGQLISLIDSDQE